MNKAMREVLGTPQMKAQFAKVGVEAHASSPAELKERLVSDIKKWNAVIDKAGIPRK
jgi:tripartite-type tricarboxylate transporter receptor subunit TctC